MSLKEQVLEARLSQVTTSQGSIETLSKLCLHYKSEHKKIARIWLRCLQKSKVTHRLTLIYLANDIIQNAKRKNAAAFIDSFKSLLREAIPYLRDEKIKSHVERVFSIWQDRAIYDNKFISELRSTLNSTSRSSSSSAATAATAHGGDSTTTTKTTQQSYNNNNSNSNSNNNNDSATALSNDLIQSLNKLAFIEKSVEKLRASDDNIVDRLSQGSLSESDASNNKMMEDLKTYIIALKTEIEERNKVSRLLEDSIVTQKRLLKDSEDMLLAYKSRLDYIVKLREDLS